MERLILARLTFKLPRPKNLFGFTKGRSTVDPILHLLNVITNRRKKIRAGTVYTAFLYLDKAFERANHIVILDSLISLGIKGRIIAWVEDFLNNREIKVTVQGVKSDPHPLTTGSPQGSALSPTLFNALITVLISISVPKCVDILAYADDIAIISYGPSPAKKLQTALDTTASKANDLGLFFSPAKTKIIAFNTNSKQNDTFHIGQQDIEIVKQYKYLGVIIDNRLNFNTHALQTKQKIYSRLNIIKIISNVKAGMNTKNLINLYKALIQSILLYAAPIYLLSGKTAIKHLEIAQRTALKYILGLPPSAPTALISREAGIPPIAQLIKGETAKYIIRTATKPDPVQIASKTQESLNKDTRVHIQRSWAMKAAAIQRDMEIPFIHPPKAKETAPWRDHPLTIIIENNISKTQNLLGAFTEATDRIASLNRHRAAINIYTDASVHQDGKSAWSCFVEGVCPSPCGRLPDHTPVTLAELHAIHAALAWREAQDRHEDTIIHSDSMAAIKILAQTKTQTYPEITTKIINSAFNLSQRGSLTILNWVPSHINIDGNEKADKLANEATSLTNIQHAKQTSAAYKHIITKFSSTFIIDKINRTNQNNVWSGNDQPNHREMGDRER
jgi:ribonuclease HI